MGVKRFIYQGLLTAERQIEMKIVENYIKVFTGYRPNIWKWIVVSLVFTFCDVPLNNRFIRNIYWIIRTEHKCSRVLSINLTSNQRWFKSLKKYLDFFFAYIYICTMSVIINHSPAVMAEILPIRLKTLHNQSINQLNTVLEVHYQHVYFGLYRTLKKKKTIL